MPIVAKPVRTKTARTSHEIVNVIGPGPYLAKVIGHLDKQFMGSLKVQLLRSNSSGDDSDREGQVKIVSYASPFYGVTPLHSATGSDNYQNTQQSYGFWAVPPDVGTLVLVTFVEGRDDSGFWFACVQDDYMNFMVPDGRAATANTTNATPQYLKGKKLPVGEYNKNLVSPNGQNQPTYYPRPYNNDFVKQLEEQGLLDDDVRGITSSSARRETPSSVFGISTPGPLDKRSGAPKVYKGTQEVQANMFSSRLGGHSVVMDDGDDKILRKGPAHNNPAEYVNKDANEPGGDPTLPANELFRIRTRTGHQILLHNTEDLIYIGNSKGTAWIELTANGKIDVYAQDSVSIHSNQDLNFTADRDINFTAFENMNIVVGNEFKQDVGNSTSLTTGTFYTLNAGDSISNNAASFISLYAEDSFTAIAKTGMNLLCEDTLNIGSSTEIGIEACNYVKISTDGDFHTKALGNIFIQSDAEMNILSNLSTKITSGNTMNIKSTGANVLITGGPNIHLNGPVAVTASNATLPVVPDPIIPIDPLRAAQTARVPRHEPWYQHENLNPAAYTPEKTRAGNEQVDSFPVPRTNGGTGVLPDTYLPPTRQHQSGTINASYYPNFDATTGSADTYRNGTWDATRDPTVNSYRGTPGEPIPVSKVPAPINGFTLAETAAFLGAIGKRESNNAYDAVNSLGYSGKYQFGVAALEDLGYIVEGTWETYKKNRVLSDPSVWTGKNGITSQQAWLAAEAEQERVMIEYTNRNLRTLTRIGALQQGDDKGTIMGMLAGSHLLGAGGMKKWRNGEGGADAYGTTGGEYFGLGRAAYASVSGSSTTTAV